MKLITGQQTRAGLSRILAAMGRVLLLAAPALAANDATLQGGAAKVDLTPPLEMKAALGGGTARA
jgi:ABC-type taurine transport system ATPase subunit